jgi:hypothetical protein
MMGNMDRIPQVNLVFENLQSTVEDSAVEWQLLLRIVADLRIEIGGEVLYLEHEFPVVEFGAQANRWLKGDLSSFRYNSMESEIEPLIKFKSCGNDKFLLCSPHQKFDADVPVEGAILRAAVTDFLERLATCARGELSIDLGPLLRQ